ncbi:SUMF1/EgtB/PvdO family nonheme iron enzyme [Croceimicrobium hydrocarbonivorans]|uniref:SUMF1/EgtB/PvdO family nonheme iron enzyme n=1 Tax=Croceimicrobium hydrocarbonivorans TaxID=2761580 RepID=A0A7H0VHK3_9FLAO|nr:SUMF1/EgtB/PvdO family nonheme iron enzyme [Croceimicrobium hydrocarbonivorans]QNR25201.1 SUMF1/EgtB/PvdO family nonheme iron enzyme [Croceimicrobium hydrocarbonivorans]
MKNLVLLLIAFPFLAWSNNIQVGNVQINVANDPYRPVITCDISWENGWRIDGGAEFMDAAWIFVKYRTAAMPVWRHGKISSNSIVSGDMASKSHQYRYGLTVFSSVDTVGTISGTVALTLDSLFTSSYGLEVQVHAIEMVKVPAGPYYVGDGNSNEMQWLDEAYFGLGIDEPYYISQDSIIDMSSSNRPFAVNGTTPSGNILANTKEFFIMKYELSYEQYAAFLNTLERPQQNLRTRLDINSNSTPSYRFAMTPVSHLVVRSAIAVDFGYDTVVGPLTFYCDLNNNGIGNEPDDGMNLAAVDLRIADVISYARWCGLILPTEFQYEKACRGPLKPVKGEFAWGTSSIYVDSTYQNTSHLTSQGTAQEAYTNPQPYTAHIGIPYVMAQRCGINATASSETRGQASASYYGIQDLTGGASEVYCLQEYSLANQLNGDPNLGTPGTASGWSNYIIKGLGAVINLGKIHQSNVSSRGKIEPLSSASFVGGRLAL